jgi:hypothetical protein
MCGLVVESQGRTGCFFGPRRQLVVPECLGGLGEKLVFFILGGLGSKFVRDQEGGFTPFECFGAKVASIAWAALMGPMG